MASVNTFTFQMSKHFHFFPGDNGNSEHWEGPAGFYLQQGNPFPLRNQCEQDYHRFSIREGVQMPFF